MRYASLFSGIGGFELGIRSVFANSTCVACSEIDESALSVYNQHFKQHQNLGDISRVSASRLRSLGTIDLLVGGPPCQNLSSAMGIGRQGGNRRGLQGDKSRLFYEFARVLHTTRAKHFIMENVASMSNDEREEITQHLRRSYHGAGSVHIIEINSCHVSAQNRRRYYWTSFRVKFPHHSTGPSLSTILDSTTKVQRPEYAIAESSKRNLANVIPQWGKTRWQHGHFSDTSKSKSITVTRSWESPTMGCMIIDRRFPYSLRVYGGTGSGLIRRVTPEEAERLQCFPVGWTKALAKTARYKSLGNAVTVNVITHICKSLSISLDEA